MLHDLPTEIYLAILTFLSTPDVMRLSMVSHKDKRECEDFLLNYRQIEIFSGFPTTHSNRPDYNRIYRCIKYFMRRIRMFRLNRKCLTVYIHATELRHHLRPPSTFIVSNPDLMHEARDLCELIRTQTHVKKIDNLLYFLQYFNPDISTHEPHWNRISAFLSRQYNHIEMCFSRVHWTGVFEQYGPYWRNLRIIYFFVPTYNYVAQSSIHTFIRSCPKLEFISINCYDQDPIIEMLEGYETEIIPNTPSDYLTTMTTDIIIQKNNVDIGEDVLSFRKRGSDMYF